MTAPAIDEDAVLGALHGVTDPCSIAANCALSIVDMGLVLGWHADADGSLEVVLCVTAPVCLMGTVFGRDAEDELRRIAGVTSVTVTFDRDFVWSPDRMTESGRRKLAHHRERSRELVQTRPRAWRTTSPLLTIQPA